MAIDDGFNGNVPEPDETDLEALDDRTRLDIRAEESAWGRAPAGLQDAIESFDRETGR